MFVSFLNVFLRTFYLFFILFFFTFNWIKWIQCLSSVFCSFLRSAGCWRNEGDDERHNTFIVLHYFTLHWCAVLWIVNECTILKEGRKCNCHVNICVFCWAHRIAKGIQNYALCRNRISLFRFVLLFMSSSQTEKNLDRIRTSEHWTVNNVRKCERLKIEMKKTEGFHSFSRWKDAGQWTKEGFIWRVKKKWYCNVLDVILKLMVTKAFNFIE